VPCDAQRLDERANIEWDVRRQRNDGFLWYHYVFAQPPAASGQPDEAAVVAHVLAASKARVARPAGDGGLDDALLADGEALDVRPEFSDDA
jgi:hypothetical protein